MPLGPLIGRVLAIVAVLMALYGLGWSVVNIGTVVRMLAIACFSAYLVNPVVKRLQSRGMSRNMAIASVFLAFVTGLAVVFYLLVPVVQRQVVLIGEEVQGFASSSDEHIARLQVVLEEKLPGDFMKGRDLKIELDQRLQGVTEEAVRVVTTILLSAVSNLIYVFLLPMMVFLILADAPFFQRQLIKSIPNRYFEVTHRLLCRIDDQLGGYIRGVIVVTFCVGTVSTIGLWMCGMEYFFVVGPLLGLLNMIPIFGPMIGMGIAALVMLFQTGEVGSLAGPIVVGVTAQVLDNVAFTPIVVSRSVDLHPLLVLLMTLIGGELLGLMGLLLSVPVTATAKVVIQAIQETKMSRRFAGCGAVLAEGVT